MDGFNITFRDGGGDDENTVDNSMTYHHHQSIVPWLPPVKQQTSMKFQLSSSHLIRTWKRIVTVFSFLEISVNYWKILDSIFY